MAAVAAGLTAGGSAARRSSSLPFMRNTRAMMQQEVLTALVAKHIKDPALAEIIVGADAGPTSKERGVTHWEHSHLVAALDGLNAYQRDRKARTSLSVLGRRLNMQRNYRNDPRTRMVELLKQWLRSQAGRTNLDEDEIRCICGLCRDVLDHADLFPSRNALSFTRCVANVYRFLQWQLREVLEKDRTCAELADRVLSLSRNLLSDALVYLLLAPTDLKQTDAMPSLEIVALWQSLPSATSPLPNRADLNLQKTMKDAWKTRCGGIISALISTPWCVRLFDGRGAREESAAASAARTSAALEDVRGVGGPSSQEALSPQEKIKMQIAEAREEFRTGKFRYSGLAGALRRQERQDARDSYLKAVEAVCDLAYLLGEALVQFHRISDGLGDYGMIRVAPWLHPFLEALVERVHRLQSALGHLDESLCNALVLARARGEKVDAPAPSARMTARAHNAIARAITDKASHAQGLIQALEALRARSAPERLPHLMDGLGDACQQLQAVIQSPEFRACVKDVLPDLPTLCNSASQVTALALTFNDARTRVVACEEDSDEEIVDQSCRATQANVLATVPVGLTTPAETPAGQVASKDMNPFKLDQDTDVEGATTGCEDHDPSITSSSVVTSSPSTSVSSSSHRRPPLPTQRREGNTSTRSGESDISPVFYAPTSTSAHVVLPTSCGSQVRSTSPGGVMIESPELWADVYRMSMNVFSSGWKRHDRRSIRLLGGFLHIFDKGSTRLVKTVVDVRADVEDCAKLSPSMLCLGLRRRHRDGERRRAASTGAGRRSSSLTRSVSAANDAAKRTWQSLRGAPLEKETHSRESTEPTDGSEGFDQKSYVFEFESAAKASAFQGELQRLLRSR